MAVHRLQHFKPFLQRSQKVFIDYHLPGLAVFGPAELFLLFLEQGVLIGKRPDRALQRIFFVAEDALLHLMRHSRPQQQRQAAEYIFNLLNILLPRLRGKYSNIDNKSSDNTGQSQQEAG
ncbi:hypothetical protein D3C74_440180 [compost metagenome]